VASGWAEVVRFSLDEKIPGARSVSCIFTPSRSGAGNVGARAGVVMDHTIRAQKHLQNGRRRCWPERAGNQFEAVCAWVGVVGVW